MVSAILLLALDLNSRPLIIQDNQSNYGLGGMMYLLEDSDKKLTVEDVRKIPESKFHLLETDTIGVGYTSSAYWVHFRILNHSSLIKSWVLEIEWPHIEYLDFYVFQQDQLILTRNTGYLLDYDTRDYKSRNFIFKIPRSSQTLDLYFRFESRLPLAVRSQKFALLKAANEKFIFGGYFGLIVVMILYNYFLFISLNDRTYLLYVNYVLFFGLYTLAVSGYIVDILPYKFIGRHYLLPLSIICIWAPLNLFLMSFLHTREKVPILNWVHRIFLGSLFIFNVPLFFIDLKIGTQVIDLTALMMILLVTASAAISLAKGYRPARFVLLAFSIWMVGAMLTLLRNFQVLPNNFFTTYGMQIGSASEIVLLAFALADRINIIKKERDDAQIDSIASKEVAIQSLEKANSIKDEFLAGISHELRTPLQGILGIAESEIHANQNLPPDSHTNLELIIASASRLSYLVNDILDYSRLRHREIPLRLRAINVQAIAQHILELNRILISGKAIELINLIPPDFPALAADEDRLRQIFQNLIGNAIKFTSQGFIKVFATHDGKVSQITISDTGIGIEVNRLQSIFLSFEQGQAGAQQSGTGIGLAITKKLVGLHGGKITVKSRLNQGTQFTISLPLSNDNAVFEKNTQTLQGHAEDIIAYARLINPEGKASIMVVDDEPMNLKVICNHYTSANYSVILFGDGTSALDYLESQTIPDLVVLDMMMPGMSGLELCKKIRSRYTSTQLPILFVTVRNQTNDLLAALNAGAGDYLVKPFVRDELLVRTQNLMAGHELDLQKHRNAAQLNEALKQERERIYADLHDHLGARLTDLSFAARKLLQEKLLDPALTQELDRTVRETSQILRDRLLSLEDLQHLSENYIVGMRLILLRRYSSSGRILRFQAFDEFEQLVSQKVESGLKAEFYAITREICTNDLKYGYGESKWKITNNNNSIELQINTQTNFNVSSHGTGKGTGILQRRTAQLGGNLSFTLNHKELEILCIIPLNAL